MKKIVTAAVAILVVLFLGALGSRVAEREIFPRLADVPFFAQYDFFKNVKKNTRVIEKTEQIVVREDDSINAVSSQASASVVHVISRTAATRRAPVTVQEGAGVVLASDGLIVTHKDAIAIGDTVTHLVLLSDGALHGATLQSVDPFTDIAFLTIDAENLTSMALANSDDARAGKKLIAMSNGSQENQSRYASGLLSHVNKAKNIDGVSVVSSDRFEGFFELDFNNLDTYLGGPVIDFNGEMVGIVGRHSAGGTADGDVRYGLVPSNTVRDALNIFVETQTVVRTPFGMTYTPITKAYAAAYELPRDRGALVVTPGIRGARAGLQVGDIITKIGDTDIDLDHPVSHTLANTANPAQITITIMRGEVERVVVF